MITTDKRNAILELHRQGQSLRQIARLLGAGRNTVGNVLASGTQIPAAPPKASKIVDPELLRQLYTLCEGRLQRLHEKLTEEHSVKISYPALGRLLRRLGIHGAGSPRCAQVPDEPGLEMQHDTTLYPVMLGDQRVRLVASLLYLRYSKRRYLCFYRHFTRFHMKCFLHRALMHWGYSPKQCIIDNTNLARLAGAGAYALIHPEMEAFARQYRFVFRCHAIRHSDRKAGVERSFHFVETNFLPGRSFRDLEDLNQQAFEWATIRQEHRAQGKSRLIPAKAFELEIPSLQLLPAGLPAPYLTEDRRVDRHGYIAWDANYYWVPGTERGEVKLLVYDDHLEIYRHRERLVKYPLAPDGVRGKTIALPGATPPIAAPNNRKQESSTEETRLRQMDPVVGQFIDLALATPGRQQRHQWIKRLFGLSRRIAPPLFFKSLTRAFHYKTTCLETLERIAVLLLNEGTFPPITPPHVDDFENRDTYRQGELTDPPDFSPYQDPQEGPPDSPSSDIND